VLAPYHAVRDVVRTTKIVDSLLGATEVGADLLGRHVVGVIIRLFKNDAATS
jgi:hypothetical protein